MNKVISINLNGRAYQLEEKGYEALREYLDKAAAKLHENPDKDEIMADFEQAIADKCSEYLRGHKNVVSAEDVEAIIAKMGPVDGEEHKTHADKNEKPAEKRLYRIPQNGYLGGVCAGIAAYFNFDVTIVRIVFIVLLVATHVSLGLIYILFWIFIPAAYTDEERAQAHGERWNAQEFMDKAKAHYAEYAATHDKREWKRHMREWKHELKHKWKQDMYYSRPNRDEAWTRVSRIGAGIVSGVMGILIAILTFILVIALWSFLAHGIVFGYAIGAGHPAWVTIVFLIAFFHVVTTPLRLLAWNAWGRPYNFFRDIMNSLFFILAVYLLVLTARELFPLANAACSIVVDTLGGVRR